jgi:hypothetical protein
VQIIKFDNQKKSAFHNILPYFEISQLFDMLIVTISIFSTINFITSSLYLQKKLNKVIYTERYISSKSGSLDFISRRDIDFKFQNFNFQRNKIITQETRSSEKINNVFQCTILSQWQEFFGCLDTSIIIFFKQLFDVLKFCMILAQF